MGYLVFDIETVPDVATGRRLHGLEGLPDEDVGKAMAFHQLQATGSDFLPLHLQRVVAIAVVWRHRETLRAYSLGDPDSDEAELVRRFFEAIEKATPDLVSWNGSGFDLPVLHYRSLLHGIQAPRYWETGDGDQSFRFNNYLNRFHWRHTDLMDVLSGYQGRSRASLNDMATMLGFPGKLGFAGDQVWDRYLAGDLEGIRQYCETDVLNTWLVFLRFQHLRGHLDAQSLAGELDRVRAFLEEGSSQPHWQAFRSAWQAAGNAGADRGRG